jgi:acyl-CoA synthetase (AMP-forming)/AMP-acid ligase II
MIPWSESGMVTIIQRFLNTVESVPLKTALICDEQDISYQQLAEMVGRYSALLADNGVAYGDHVGVLMNNSVESVALIMSAAGMGVALVPVNPTMPIRDIHNSFSSCGVKHIIGRSRFFERYLSEDSFLPNGICFVTDKEVDGCIRFSDKDYKGQSFVDNRVDGNESLILCMTSGSTGTPKPIVLTQNNKLARALSAIEVYQLTSEDVIMAATPLYHSLAERLVILPLIAGATSVLMDRFTPALWLKKIEEYQVTFTIAVSAQLAQVAELISSPFSSDIDSLHCVVSSSALLESSVKKELISKLRCDFHEMYGTSETATVTDISFREFSEKQGSVGRALPRAEIKIIDENNMPQKQGVIGEIICKSSTMFNGYYNQPELTASSMVDGFFRTGDYGYLDADDFLYFTSRKKEIIITGGINVYPRDIEQCLMGLSQIAECAAFSLQDDRLVEIVAIAIVLKKGTELTERQIRTHCARNLADYQQPREVFFLDGLPKNTMDKLQRGKLQEIIQTTRFSRGLDAYGGGSEKAAG